MKVDPSEFEHFFRDFPSHCPYGMARWAVYRQVAVREIDPKIYEALILSGCRRTGNLIYKMACPGCRECVPIRMEAARVRYNSTQRKIRNKNKDLRVLLSRPECTEEKLELYRKFLRLRYPARRAPDRRDYEDFFVNTCTDTWEVEYRLEGKIVGVATVDVGEKILNGVYFYFDPDMEKRSPGVYNFIYLTEFCKEKGIPYFVTGYYIQGLSAMAYKAQFHPHELFMDGAWRRREKAEDPREKEIYNLFPSIDHPNPI